MAFPGQTRMTASQQADAADSTASTPDITTAKNPAASICRLLGAIGGFAGVALNHPGQGKVSISRPRIQRLLTPSSASRTRQAGDPREVSAATARRRRVKFADQAADDHHWPVSTRARPSARSAHLPKNVAVSNSWAALSAAIGLIEARYSSFVKGSSVIPAYSSHQYQETR